MKHVAMYGDIYCYFCTPLFQPHSHLKPFFFPLNKTNETQCWYAVI